MRHPSDDIKTRSVIIFGCGIGGQRALSTLMDNECVVAFCDNDPAKQGSSYQNYHVIAPNEIESMDYDLILIASQHYTAIQNQLIDLGINPTKIETITPEVLVGKSNRNISIDKLYRNFAARLFRFTFHLVSRWKKPRLRLNHND